MIGGLVLTHGDDHGLVCPPRLAPVQVAIVPIWKSDDERAQVAAVAGQVKAELDRAGVRGALDLRDTLKPGAKYFGWGAKGVPLRPGIGPRGAAPRPPVSPPPPPGQPPPRPVPP